MEEKGSQDQKPKTNVYDAILQVFIEAIQRGVLIPLLLAVLVAALWLGTLWLFPESRRADEVHAFFDGIKRLWWIGYSVALLVGAGWYAHWRWVKHRNQWEINRMADERNHWQKVAYELKAALEKAGFNVAIPGASPPVPDKSLAGPIISSTEPPKNPGLFDQFDDFGEGKR
jgi:hypothetical protein